MKVVTWNVRGTGRPDFVSQVRKLLKDLTPDILFLFETRVNANRSIDILAKLQFDCFDFVNLVGFSGGLWLCWNSNVISMDIIMKNDKMFHCMVYFSNLNINCFFFTFLYGYPQHFKQKEIWDMLLNIKNSIIGPSAIVGDFNEILHAHEKIAIDNCHLLETRIIWLTIYLV